MKKVKLDMDKMDANIYIKNYIGVLADFIDSYQYDMLTQIKKGKIVKELKQCKKFLSQ